MIQYRLVLGAAAGFLALGEVCAQAQLAAANIDLNSLDAKTNPGIVDIGRPVPAAPPIATPSERTAGNPLWTVPIKSLSVTLERPLFSPSRRPPPPPPVIAYVPPPPKPAAPAPAEPDHPLLSLLGTVVGSTEGIAVFVDDVSNDVVRLRTGQNHAGWTLRSVAERETRFEKGNRTATLALPPPATAEQVAQPGSLESRRRHAEGQVISPPPPLISNPPPLINPPQPNAVGMLSIPQGL